MPDQQTAAGEAALPSSVLTCGARLGPAASEKSLYECSPPAFLAKMLFSQTLR